MASKPSITEIARQSGVSVATVSRIIHQNGRFSKETEERVRKVMEQADYSPSVIAQSMRRKVMPIISIIVPDLLFEPAGLFVRAAQQRLNKFGYSVTVFNSRSDRELTQNYIEMMKRQCVAGFMVIPDNCLEKDCFGDTPVLFAWNEPSFPLDRPYIIAKFDYATAGKIATELLIERGCMSIGFLGSNLRNSYQKELYEGYSEALARHGIVNRKDLHFPVDYLRTTEGIALLKKHLDDNGLDFDAILCSSQRHVIAALSVFRERGISVPGEVRLVGYGEMRIANYGLLKYTAIAENEEVLAWSAADMLVRQIRHEEYSSVIVEDVSLHEGMST